MENIAFEMGVCAANAWTTADERTLFDTIEELRRNAAAVSRLAARRLAATGQHAEETGMVIEDLSRIGPLGAKYCDGVPALLAALHLGVGG